MSDLKYQSVEQLKRSHKDCESYLKKLGSQVAGQKERLKWIEQYIFEKTPQELTIDQIERLLGHKVIIKESN